MIFKNYISNNILSSFELIIIFPSQYSETFSKNLTKTKVIEVTTTFFSEAIL